MNLRSLRGPFSIRLLTWLPRLVLAGAAIAGVATGGTNVAQGDEPNIRPPGGALAGERPRVIVSTDIGGSDPDDFQSLVHLLVYADVLDLEGLISSPPGKGRRQHLLEAIDAYEQDYPQLKRHSADYPAPQSLRAISVQGAILPAPAAGYTEPTEGSRLLIERAQANDARPLYVLVWGSITDVAQAVHDRPSIKQKLRIYSIGSWNTAEDKAARNYLFQHQADLWWIESNTTFRGMYMGGDQQGDLSNRGFLDQHVAGHGALGELLIKKKRDIKMGDTPSLLYLLRGPADDPTADHWGGAYLAARPGLSYWTDDPRPAARDAGRAGAKTVSRWRADYLRDWQNRMDRLSDR